MRTLSLLLLCLGFSLGCTEVSGDTSLDAASADAAPNTQTPWDADLSEPDGDPDDDAEVGDASATLEDEPIGRALAPRGRLTGVVVPTPIEGVSVEALGWRRDAWRHLGEAQVGEDGHFAVLLPEYHGPVFLVVRGDEAATYLGPVSQKAEPWPAGVELRALLPGYRPPMSRTVVISPLSDLTLAFSDLSSGELPYLSARQNLVANHFATHFQFRNSDDLLYVMGAAAWPGEARHRMVAGCLDWQAQQLGADSLLVLTELYRLDAQDQALDGQVAGEPVRWAAHPQVELPRDPFRGRLASACFDLLTHPDWQGEMTIDAALNTLKFMINNRDSVLFGHLDPPRKPIELEDRRPKVRVEVAPVADEPTSRVSAGALRPLSEPATLAAGPVRLTVVVTHPTGLALDADGHPKVTLVLQDGLTLSLASQSGLPGQFEATTVLHTEQLGVAEGEVVGLVVRAESAEHRVRQEVFGLQIDGDAPRITVEPHLAGAPQVDTSAMNPWYTQGTHDDLWVDLRVEDHLPTAWFVEHDGVPFAGGNVEGAGRAQVRLPVLAWAEGRIALRFTATDALGNAAVVERTLVIDRTPPQVHLLPSVFRDEAGVTATWINGAPRLVWPDTWVDIAADRPEGQPIPFNRLYDGLTPEHANLPSLRFEVEDASPMQAVSLRGVDLQPVEVAGTDYSVRLDQAILGVEDGPTPAGHLWQPTLRLTDAAGNAAAIALPAFELNLLPLPVIVVTHLDQAAPDRLPVAALAGLSAPNGSVLLGEWTVLNPWSQQVRLELPRAAVGLDATARLEPGRPSDVLGVGDRQGTRSFFLPAPGGLPRVVEGDCLVDPQGNPRADVEAEAMVRQEQHDRLYEVIRPRGCGPRQPRESHILGLWSIRFTLVDGPEGDLARLDAESSVVVRAELIGAQFTPFDLAQLDHLRDQLTGLLRGGVPFDPTPRLLWNEQICFPSFPCQRGWWLTQRTQWLSQLSLEHLPMALTARLDAPQTATLATTLSGARQMVWRAP